MVVENIEKVTIETMVWYCENCKTTYLTKEDAELCEAKHKN